MTGSTRPAGGVAVVTATGGTVLIAAMAFWLSFTALTNLARRSGVAEGQAWAWPLILDGLVVVATVAVVALDRERTAWYPWLLLITATLVSVTANALHATVTADPQVPGLLAGCVAAVPPLVLLASTHLTVVLVRSQHAPRSAPVEAEQPDTANAVPAGGPAGMAGPVVRRAAVGGVTAGRRGRRELAARLRVEGWSNKAIARQLGVAPSTVGRWFPRPDTTPAAPAKALGAPDRHDTHTEPTA